MAVEHGVSSWQTKLARADHHLETLYRKTDEWGESDPLTMEREINADGSEHLFRLRLKTEPDVWAWAAILGDALHNLRGALDHIVFALAVAQTGRRRPTTRRFSRFPSAANPNFSTGSATASSRWTISRRQLSRRRSRTTDSSQASGSCPSGGSRSSMTLTSTALDTSCRSPQLLT